MEQSLKAVVNLHRSLIAASVVAFVLGLTTGGAGPEEVLRVRAEELLAVDFKEYETFVSRQAAGHVAMLPGQADIFEAALADRGVRLSTAGSFLMSDLFDPVGVSTVVRIQNSVFEDQGQSSLTDLSETASAFGDAELFVPDPVSLAEGIKQVIALGREEDDPREVTGVRRAAPPPVLQMPFVGDGTKAVYSFSYREHVGGPDATQQITLSAETKAHPVPGTSLIDWLRQQPRLGDGLFSASRRRSYAAPFERLVRPQPVGAAVPTAGAAGRKGRRPPQPAQPREGTGDRLAGQLTVHRLPDRRRRPRVLRRAAPRPRPLARRGGEGPRANRRMRLAASRDADPAPARPLWATIQWSSGGWKPSPVSSCFQRPPSGRC